MAITRGPPFCMDVLGKGEGVPPEPLILTRTKVLTTSTSRRRHQDFDSCGSVVPKGTTDFWRRKADRPSDRPYRGPVPDITSGLLGAPSTGLRPAFACHATGPRPALHRPSTSRRRPQDFDSCGSVVPKGSTKYWSRKPDRPSDRPYRGPVPDIISGQM